MKGEDFKNGDALAKQPDDLLACAVLAATCQCCQYFVAEVNSVCGVLFGFFLFLPNCMVSIFRKRQTFGAIPMCPTFCKRAKTPW